MKSNRDKQGSTRILLLVVGSGLICGLVLAQSLRITNFKADSTGKVTLQYGGSSNGLFRLLYGPTVTNIVTPLATNGLTPGSSSFIRQISGPGASPENPVKGFYQVQQLAGNPTNTPLTTLTSSPANGETDVSVTRPTVLRFSNPLAQSTVLSNDVLFAEYGGRKILSRIELSSDRLTATLFYLEPIPASARIRVEFHADTVFDSLGRAVDADGDRQPGGVALIDFDTLSITPIGQTAIMGRVFASELVPDANGTTNTVNKPLPGVTITVDGAEQTLRTTTDAMGNFTLQPCPAGNFFVHIDGRTSPLSNYPNGSYYPFVGKEWQALANRTDNLAGGTGDIYLPLIVAGTLQPVSATSDTVITFPPSVVASNPALTGVSVTVPANSLFSDDGTRGGKVGIAPVSPDRLPGPLPPGLEFPLVITVQTDGALNFDTPAPVCFPNLPDPGTGKALAPGEKNYLYSFNHRTGQWEAVGPMTVSPDGKLVCTDPGVGILQPGWHGVGPQPIGPPGKPLLGCGSGKVCCFGGPPGDGLEFSKCAFLKCGGDGDIKNIILAPITCFIAIISCQVQVCLHLKAEVADLGLASAPSSGLDINGIEAVASAYGQALELALPFASKHQEIDSATQSQIDTILQNAAAAINEPLATFLGEQRIIMENMFINGGHPEGVGGSPSSNPVNFAAIINRPSSQLIVRGVTQPFGQYQLFVPADGSVQAVYFYDPASRTYGFVTPNLSPQRTFELPHPYMYSRDTLTIDTDHDGLPDEVEFVMGTDPGNPDTDGDGIPDGAEVDNGTNPLDGRPVATGIIAAADAAGTAVDVCAINNLAITADSDGGISVFNVLAGLNPVRVAQVSTPGTALAVTCSGNLVGVADGSGGFEVVDISDPPSARIVQHVPISSLGGGSAQAAASAANLAFVGTTQGSVSMVDVTTGVLLQKIDLGTDFPVSDLAVEGTTLYAYAGSKLFVLPFALGPMEMHGSIDVPPASLNLGQLGRLRLFVGNSIAYVVVPSGYRTFDVSNPDAPTLIAGGNTSQLGWMQVVPNGSGSALAVRGVNPRLDVTSNVSLYDVSNPTNNDVFLTTFATPAPARAAAIYNGIGYVADSASGLQEVNYLAYDNKGQPPTGVLQVSSTNGTVTGGGFVVLRAQVKDDVQVRDVEFYVNGSLIVTDGNFPFETVYRVPTNEVGTNVTFSINIYDTGGNKSSVTNAALAVVPDDQPPGIVINSPKDGQQFFVGDDVPLDVTAIDNTGVASVTFQLNGVAVPVRRLSLSDWQIDLPVLPLGTNTLNATATDLSGLSSNSKPVRFVILREAISRELSVFNFGPKNTPEAISREVSAFNLGPPDVTQAISRALSLFNGGAPVHSEAISREVSTFNFGPVDHPEAISREVSVGNTNSVESAALRPTPIGGSLRAASK